MCKTDTVFTRKNTFRPHTEKKIVPYSFSKPLLFDLESTTTNKTSVFLLVNVLQKLYMAERGETNLSHKSQCSVAVIDESCSMSHNAVVGNLPNLSSIGDARRRAFKKTAVITSENFASWRDILRLPSCRWAEPTATAALGFFAAHVTLGFNPSCLQSYDF